MNRSTAKWIMTTIQCRKCCERVDPSEVGNDFLCASCHVHRHLFPRGEVNDRRRGHIFLPGALIRTIPKLYATENTPVAEKTIHAHYFASSIDWYIAELDPETGDAFGYCDAGDGFAEWGYSNLVEMERTLAFGLLPVERDVTFTRTTARELGLA